MYGEKREASRGQVKARTGSAMQDHPGAPCVTSAGRHASDIGQQVGICVFSYAKVGGTASLRPMEGLKAFFYFTGQIIEKNEEERVSCTRRFQQI